MKKTKHNKFGSNTNQEVLAKGQENMTLHSSQKSKAEQVPDIEQIKKKIKDLEEELKDTQEDLSIIEKKLKSKSHDFSELNSQYEQLNNSFNTQKNEIERIQNELSLKTESLKFVQSILSAKEVKNSSTNEIYEKISEIRRFFEEEILVAIDRINKNDDKESDISIKEGLKRWEIIKKKRWIADKTTIAFVGEFSAGKTSIINSILSQSDNTIHLLPVDMKATTAIPTYISGGVKTDYFFFTNDNRLKSIPKKDFYRVTKNVLKEVDGVSNLIKYFVMTCRIKNLNNLSILDTPGFNSNDKDDGKRTIEVINECDALFWVIDVNVGTVNRTSVQLIKKHLKKPLYIVINKTDTKSKSEVDTVEKDIKAVLSREKVNVVSYIRFSKKDRIANIMTPIRQIKKSDDYSNYIEAARDKVENVLKDLKKIAKNKKEEHNKCIRKVRSTEKQFNLVLAELLKKCETASGLPQKHSRVFKTDYRMTKSDYNRFCDLLENISATRDDILELYDQQKDNQQESQKTYQDWQSAINNTKLISNLMSRWEKMINKIK